MSAVSQLIVKRKLSYIEEYMEELHRTFLFHSDKDDVIPTVESQKGVNCMN